MMIPRKGDTIDVLPYGRGIVEKNIGDGRVVVTLERMIRKQGGGFTNQVVAELHPVWCAVGGVEE